MPSIVSFAAAAALVGLAQSACTEIGGNYYCNPVTAVVYNNFGGSGSYNRVSFMDDNTGVCNFSSYSYSGSNAPFDEELSLHFRGPIQLKQFAYYTPSAASSKVKREEHSHHQHKNVHARDFAYGPPSNIFAKLAASPTAAASTNANTISCPASNGTTYTVNGDSFTIECGFDRAGNINMVYAANFATCIQGCAAYSGCVDVSYVSNGGGACYYKGSVLAPSYNSGVWGARLLSGSSSSSIPAQSSTVKTSSTSAQSSTVKTSSTSAQSSTVKTSSTLSTSTQSSTATTFSVSTIKTSSTSTIPTSTSIQTSSTSSTSASPAATGNGWTQQSYYSSTAGTANNVAFLNNMGGGSVSGVWSTNFGSSLSYASADGTAAASSPQVLQDTTVSGEVILFQGQKCGAENTDCGYYRPGTVAYHGFGGARKIFLIEFGMPTNTANVPAIWLLNALIPRTQQYGSCTCWGNTNGCGEIDLFEVLTTSASNYMTSSIHGVQAGGDSDYFVRPTTGTIKAAIILDGGVLQISILPSTYNFASSLSATDYATLKSVTNLVSSDVTLA